MNASPFWAAAVSFALCSFCGFAQTEGKTNIPEFYGLYVVVNGKPISIIGGKQSQELPTNNVIIYSIASGTSKTNVAINLSADVKLIAFDPSVSDLVNALKLYRLPFARNFVRGNADAALVDLLSFGKGKTDSAAQNRGAPINQWLNARLPSLEVNLLAKPVPGQLQMVQVAPEAQLAPGLYMLFFEFKGNMWTVPFTTINPPLTPQPTDCIDLFFNWGGFGGVIESDDYFLRHGPREFPEITKEHYKPCGSTEIVGIPSTTPTVREPADLGYSLLALGRLYKVKGLAAPSGGQVHVFADEKSAIVRDQELLRKLALGAWTRENIVVAPDARSGSRRVSGILSTSQDLQHYEVIQDALARAMTEAIEAAATEGASLAKAVPNLTWGIVSAQLQQSPRTLFTLMAQTGLKASLEKYKQLELILPPADATALDLATLEKVKDLYTQGQVLELPNAALASALMPQHAARLTEQAFRAILSQLLPDLSGPNAPVTLGGLLKFQKSIAEARKDIPALNAYREKLNLALDLAAANDRMIEKWAKQASSAFDSTRGDDETRAIIEKAILARGGAEQLRKFKAMHSKCDGKIANGSDLVPCLLETWMQQPSHSKGDLQFELKRKKSRMIQVLSGSTGWLNMNGRTQEATGPTLTGMKEELYAERVTNLIPLLDEPAFTISRIGEKAVEGSMAVGLNVACAGHKDVRLYFDKSTGLLVKIEQDLLDPAGKVVFRESFVSDYQPINGIQQPMKLLIFQDAKKHFEGAIREMQLLEKIDETEFSKP